MHQITDMVDFTETCRRCGEPTSEWTALMVEPHTAHLDEIEVTDATPLTVLCPSCWTGPVQADLQLAVNTAVMARS